MSKVDHADGAIDDREAQRREQQNRSNTEPGQNLLDDEMHYNFPRDGTRHQAADGPLGAQRLLGPVLTMSVHRGAGVERPLRKWLSTSEFETRTRHGT
jgi:hypothetical protein